MTSAEWDGFFRSKHLAYVMLRFAVAAAVCGAAELLIFGITWAVTGQVARAQLVSRAAFVVLSFWPARTFVFRSSQSVMSTLPGYAALAVAGAFASYSAITPFVQAGWNPVAAKFAVEAMFYFPFFVTLRLFLFRDCEDDANPLPGVRDLFFALMAAAVILVVAVSEAHGFQAEGLFGQFIWLPWGLHRFTHFAAIFAGLSFAALLFVPWAYAGSAAVLITAATVLAEGPAAVLAVAYLLISACALGSLMLGSPKQASLQRDLCATLLGVGVFVFAFTLTARVPVNYPLVWGAALAIPIALDYRGVRLRLSQWTAILRDAELRSWRERGAFALFFFVAAAQWFPVLEPDASSDGLAVHLAIPMNIAMHHAMTFQPRDFLWSVMPLSGDFAYSIVYLLGGEPAPSLLNFAFLMVIALLIYGTLRQWLERPSALLIASLFLSTPLVQLVTGSLFVENYVAAMALGTLVAFWNFSEAGARRWLLATAMLAGFAAASKVGLWAFALTALPFIAMEARRRRVGAAGWPAIALFLAAAVPPYAIAFAKTSNPLYPFMNQRFPSPLFAHDMVIVDLRFNQPLTWQTPYDLTFRTHNFFESGDGGLGFQYLLLIPLAGLALLVVRRRPAVTAAAIGLVAGIIVLISKPNGRYLYTEMPLLTIAFGALVEWSATRHRWLWRLLLACVFAGLGMNLYFEPISGWYRKDFYSPGIFRPGGRARYISETAHSRAVSQWFRKAHPHDRVLMLGEADLADMGDNSLQYNWQQHSVWQLLADSKNATSVRRTLRQLRVHFVTAHRPGPGEPLLQPGALEEFLGVCAISEFESGREYAAHIDPVCETLDDAALESKLLNATPSVVGPGDYDDFDPSLLFYGDWTRSRFFAEPDAHTISYTDAAGAQVTFAFEGESLTYVYTKAPNRGLAELTIDGVKHEVDLYSAETHWHTRLKFDQLPKGKHVVKLRPAGQTGPQSGGAYIDLDSFIVH